MEVAYSSETMVYNQKTTRRNNPEEHNLNSKILGLKQGNFLKQCQ
jgi:hypothetical protein